MLTLKRSSLLLFGLLLTIFVAACGSTATTTGSTPMGNTQAKSTPMNSAPTVAATMAPQPTAQPTKAGQTNNNNMMNNNAFIKTTQVKINGKMVTVLTNAKGLVLYYKLDDPKPNSSCTGACAKDWPPVIANAMNMMVSTSMQLPHKLTVFKTANGNQIEYNGHPLYTYAGDMTPGQFNGRAMDNVWYLVSTAL